MVTALIVAPFAIALLALLLANREDRRHPAVIPEPEPAPTVTAHVVTAQPSAAMTRPFAYDNGLSVEAPDEEDP